MTWNHKSYKLHVVSLLKHGSLGLTLLRPMHTVAFLIRSSQRSINAQYTVYVLGPLLFLLYKPAVSAAGEDHGDRRTATVWKATSDVDCASAVTVCLQTPPFDRDGAVVRHGRCLRCHRPTRHAACAARPQRHVRLDSIVPRLPHSACGVCWWLFAACLLAVECTTRLRTPYLDRCSFCCTSRHVASLCVDLTLAS